MDRYNLIIFRVKVTAPVSWTDAEVQEVLERFPPERLRQRVATFVEDELVEEFRLGTEDFVVEVEE